MMVDREDLQLRAGNRVLASGHCTTNGICCFEESCSISQSLDVHTTQPAKKLSGCSQDCIVYCTEYAVYLMEEFRQSRPVWLHGQNRLCAALRGACLTPDAPDDVTSACWITSV
jgi:hypothetical protein